MWHGSMRRHEWTLRTRRKSCLATAYAGMSSTEGDASW
eukprot:CAMPEP_0173398472 /NCGR_PEP_ID=MMETSP1356-20130122/41732_1 /TAXON_ID=77927 ORGANISM="Hemiselmis virescens, Strain PCC157" /NCGR_SAMPLE_ID=MMETSP1356 /ASSEMBLY_ACC=CAM_ASM_000847 /LENGTH=37 /DNA_ID= /DNA_START= /DNA_END= /DNA_ORIENTATION=